MSMVVWWDLFFFFKQKTAYEMRISDWSSACALPISRLAALSPLPLHQFDQLVEPRALFSFVPRGDRFCDAGSGVIFQHFALDPGKAGFNGLDRKRVG